MIKLGTNILSQTVQRYLGRTTRDLSTASERLSSGQRINKASDDAAGLAIAMSLNADSRIFSQGIRNLNDGISATSIAEGAMDQLGNIVERVQELATQSMNGTFSDVQRASMQKEVGALQAEWNRIVESTTFNGTNLLTGEGTRMVLQGSKGTNGTLSLQIGEEQLANGPAGYGGAGTVTVSTSSEGIQASGGPSAIAAISADGRYIGFSSTASNLVAGDTNGQRDAFVKDTATGITTRISTDSAGNQSVGGDSFITGISADGRYVAFYSTATNLVAGDTNGQRDAFVKDTLTGATTRISTDSSGSQAGGVSYSGAISADGRYVTFYSTAANLVAGDTNGLADAFIKDTLTGSTTRVSTDSAGGQASGGDTFVQDISADGRYVLLGSDATNLVAGDTNGQRDVFVKDRVTGSMTRISTDSAGNQALGSSSEPGAISADGRYVVYTSGASNLVTGDTNALQDIFLKDTLTGTTIRVSTDSAGNQSLGGLSATPTISADGRYVAFQSSATNLIEGDTNGQFDIFRKDTLSGEVRLLSLNSAGNQTNGPSFNAYLSADGRYAAFDSLATNLVNSDTNGMTDVFFRDLTRTGVQQMSGMVVSNRVSAGVTLTLVQNYRDEILEYRSRLGASTSRIGSFLSTLQSANVDYQAASSRITDADIATEAANSVRNTILQQAASALLAQVNQAPQIALSLLSAR